MNYVEYLMTLKMPAASIFFMVVSAAIAVFLPITLFLIFRKRYDLRAYSMFIGMAAYVIFAIILEPVFLRFMPLHSLLGVFPTPKGNIAAYVTIVCLAAGIFEETGRFIAIKYILKKDNGGLDTPLSYGIGHGGIEAVLLTGLPVISLIASSVMLNNGMLAMGFEGMTETTANEQAVTFIDAVNTSSITFFAGGIERVSAITFHICAAILIWAAVTKGQIWLYPTAVLLHAAFNVPAALYQAGVISNIWLVEVLLLMFALVFAAIVYSKFLRSKPSLPE